MEWDGPSEAGQRLKTQAAGAERDDRASAGRSRTDLEQPLLCVSSPAGDSQHRLSPAIPCSEVAAIRFLERMAPGSCLCCAGRKGQFGLVNELSLGQILQRMMGYNVVAVLNQFVTTAAFPGVSSALTKSYTWNVP